MSDNQKDESKEKSPKLGLLAILIFVLVIGAYIALDKLLLTPLIEYIRLL
ncbi:MAG: hypothetical protein IKJ06_00820 [Clostridia bacterium]|nr:hypothetical protein [Clostridia bacterium]